MKRDCESRWSLPKQRLNAYRIENTKIASTETVKRSVPVSIGVGAADLSIARIVSIGAISCIGIGVLGLEEI